MAFYWQRDKLPNKNPVAGRVSIYSRFVFTPARLSPSPAMSVCLQEDIYRPIYLSYAPNWSAYSRASVSSPASWSLSSAAVEIIKKHMYNRIDGNKRCLAYDGLVHGLVKERVRACMHRTRTDWLLGVDECEVYCVCIFIWCLPAWVLSPLLLLIYGVSMSGAKKSHQRLSVHNMGHSSSKQKYHLQAQRNHSGTERSWNGVGPDNDDRCG